MTTEVASDRPLNARQLKGATVNVEDLIALRGVKLPLRTAANATSGPHGGSRWSRHRGRGVDFAEVRLYQPGDDVRSIDWRVTARKAKPHTKVYREERERPTLIVIDQTRAMFFGSRVRMKSVAAAECAALLAWHSVDAGDRVGGLVFDDATEYAFKPFRSARAVVRLLNQIGSSNAALRSSVVVPGKRAHRLPTVLEHVVRIARNGHRVYLISDFLGFNDDDERQLKRIARHNSVALIHVSDPLEQELPPPDRYTVTDGIVRSVLSTGDTRARQRYRDDFLAHTGRLESACHATRSQFIRLSTNEAAVVRLGERLVH
ncbi:MAG TPA: DUF58 domain-containing protein [Pseudomonadales bacterium]|jgi:uncharacterized protein (DUF58 family)|nr:DUF58 domain-containing protein [Pseudomonadales bacterium]